MLDARTAVQALRFRGEPACPTHRVRLGALGMPDFVFRQMLVLRAEVRLLHMADDRLCPFLPKSDYRAEWDSRLKQRGGGFVWLRGASAKLFGSSYHGYGHLLRVVEKLPAELGVSAGKMCIPLLNESAELQLAFQLLHLYRFPVLQASAHMRAMQVLFPEGEITEEVASSLAALVPVSLRQALQVESPPGREPLLQLKQWFLETVELYHVAEPAGASHGLPIPVVQLLLRHSLARVVDFLYFHLFSKGATLADSVEERRPDVRRQGSRRGEVAASRTFKQFTLTVSADTCTSFGAYIVQLRANSEDGAAPLWFSHAERQFPLEGSVVAFEVGQPGQKLIGVFTALKINARKKDKAYDRHLKKLNPAHVELLIQHWPAFLGPLPQLGQGHAVTLPYYKLECLKAGGGLDLFRRVLELPEHRVPLSLGLPADNTSRVFVHTKAPFAVEVHMLLLFLQACKAVATAGRGEEGAASQDSWLSHRDRLRAECLKLRTGPFRDLGDLEWEVCRDTIPPVYLEAASLRGYAFCAMITKLLEDPAMLLIAHIHSILVSRATNRSSLNILGCPGASKTFSLFLAVLCIDAVLDFPVVWTSQQRAALVAVLMIAHNVLTDAPAWLRRTLLVCRVSGKQDISSTIHDHVPLTHAPQALMEETFRTLLRPLKTHAYS